MRPLSSGLHERRPARRRFVQGVALVAIWVSLVACGSPPAALPRAETTRFVALGDFGSGSRSQRWVAQSLCEWRSERRFFTVVTAGDNIYDAGEPEDFERDFFEMYSCLFDAGVGFRATLGNHDVLTRGGQPELNEPAFGMPSRYYSWTLGPVSFVMFDSNTLTDEGRDEQVPWLEEELRRAESEPWTVVVFHHPVYSGGVRHESTPGFAERFGPLFSRYGVDLVINGHDHNFQHAVADGVDYIVTGGGGAGLYDCKPELPPEVRTCKEKWHFVDVSVTRDEMSVTAVDHEGATFYEVTISPS